MLRLARYVHLLRRDIVPAVARFNDELRAGAVPLTVMPGSEIQVVDTTEYRREFERGDFCHLGDGREFTLLEFNWQRELFPGDAEELIRWICAQGMTPILAHPERHDYFWEDLSRLDGLVDAGAWLQVTVATYVRERGQRHGYGHEGTEAEDGVHHEGGRCGRIKHP